MDVDVELGQKQSKNRWLSSLRMHEYCPPHASADRMTYLGAEELDKHFLHCVHVAVGETLHEVAICGVFPRVNALEK